MGVSCKSLFKIKILNWAKHNPARKKHFKYTMIANNFCDDPKLNALPITYGWFFLNLVLMCGDINNDTVTITEQQANRMLRSRVGCTNALSALQEFQLVSYDVLPFLRIEENRKEEKGKEKNRIAKATRKQTPAAPVAIAPEVPPDSSSTQAFIAAYCNAYKAKYQITPIIRGKEAGIAKRISESLGGLGPEYARVFLQMNEPWFLTRQHSLEAMEQNLNKIKLQLEQGVSITRADIRQIENQDHYQPQMRRLGAVNEA